MRVLAAAIFCAVLAAGPASAQNAPRASGSTTSAESAFLRQHGEALAAAINHPSRAEDSARDAFRHPADTLAFWQIAPNMKVGEYAPGGQWFSRLLGHYLGGEGQLVGLFFSSNLSDETAAQERLRAAAARFPADVAGFTGLPAERFAGYTLDAVPAEQKGTFDRIIVPRMMHNLYQRGIADTELRAMRDLLKDGGMLGIEQHRAKADAPFSYANGTKGYMRQEDVVGLVEAMGFELVGTSEVNANPRDTADHPEGVWEMPPILRTKRDDLKGLGESDRMTLLFRKRA